MCILLTILSLVALFRPSQVGAEETVVAKPTSLTEIHLADFRGRQWDLADFAESPVMVVAFLGVECPLAKLYSNRLNELRAEFSASNVAFIALDANPQDSLSEMAAHARRHQIEFPFLRDTEQKLLAALGATRTPEVFVLDGKRTVRYHGRIDDQYAIGSVREKPSSRAAHNAIEALLANRSVEVPHEPAIGCLIGRHKPKAAEKSSTVNYSKHIAPIFRDACVGCHREGEIGPFPMTDYQEIAGWAEMIAEVVGQKRMPPWHANPEFGKFANDCTLSKEQCDLVLKWVADGAPEGDPADLPTPRKYVSGWQLPREPDIVLNISPKPFSVPETGEVKYQYFRVDPGFTEEKWVSAAQIVPGNRSVVHHVLVFVRAPGSRGALDGERGFLFGYVPGSITQPYPNGAAKRIPAGSELIFQVHYTPIGSAQTDQSRIGMIFADPNTIEREVITTSALQLRLNIPPEEANYKTSAMLPEELPDCQLLGLAPHMHLRGKSFRYTSVEKSGARNILLDVPKYDFNWQNGYRLAEPLPMAAGTKIFCEAVFDNSSANPNNPDPKARVRWGDQTSDEMMIGYFDILVPKGSNPTGGTSQKTQRADLIQRVIAQGLLKRLDTDKNGIIERTEIPQRWQNQFDLLDSNKDGSLTADELRESTKN